MMRKFLPLFVCVCFVAAVGQAEPIRTLLTKENQLPEKHQVEVGALGQYKELKEDFPVTAGSDTYVGSPYVRFGLFENMAVHGTVPFVSSEVQGGGSSDAGLGDASVGFDLLVWQDVFDYPYVMPHAEIGLGTGDEDKGLGTGETSATFGVAVGTTTYDVYHWAADAQFTVFDNEKDQASISASLIWDISQQFCVLAECRIADNNEKPDDVYTGDDNDDVIIHYQAGMFYKPIESLGIGVYLGGVENGEADTIASTKIAYSF